MRKIGSKKRFALVATTVAAVLIGSGVAVAYWTTTGSGTGTAATGTDTGVTITSTSTITGLYPGGPAQDIDLNIDNPGPSAQYVGTVAVAVTSTSNPGCDASDFTVTDAAVNDDVPVGATNAYTGNGATIAMINKATNQDACKNVTVNLSFTA